MTLEDRFNSLIEEQSDGVYGLAFSIVKNQADAADITQETFIRLWNHMPEIRDPSPKSWLFTTARNLSLDKLRQRRPNLSLSGSSGAAAEALFEVADPDPTPAEQTEMRSLQSQIMEAVNDMPETWKTVFNLKEVHHCSLREIAEISGYPLNSVKVYLMRARHFLQDHIRTLQNTPATS